MNDQFSGNNSSDSPRPISNGVETNPNNTTIVIPEGAALQRSALIGFLALGVIALGMIAMALAKPSAPPLTQEASAALPALDMFADVALLAKAAIVVDIQSGKTLYEKNADAQLPLASLTKVALALAVAEALPVESVVTIPYDAQGAASVESLRRGDTWRVQDIIDFTLVESSNAGAEILAGLADKTIHARFPASPEHEATLWRMNDLVQSLGLAHTYFLNVSGLDLSSTQAGSYGSARDVATLFAYAAAADSALFAGTARSNMLLTSVNGRATAAAANTNTAQGAIAGLILGKTGITDLAGGNLAIVFDVGFARPVVAVILGSSREGRFTDMETLAERTRAALRAQLP